MEAEAPSAQAGAARAQAAREATEWMILLQEGPDDAGLRQRFDAWRTSKPVNAEAWSATAHMSTLARAVLPDYVEEWRQAQVTRETRRGPRERWLLPMAALATAACLAILAVPAVLLQLRSDHATGTAEVRALVLSDGSEVTLAPGSNIATDFEGGERRVRLLSGEAFFSVKPDAARPFRVEADTVEATVLGTRFDVMRDGNGVVVAVEEGAVDVRGPLSAVAAETVKAGQSLRVTWAGAVHRGSGSPQLIGAWRRGQLYLQDQPLREAIDRLSGYFHGSIILTDAALGDRQITGAYNLGDPEEALRGMAEVLGVKVRRITPWMLVVSGS